MITLQCPEEGNVGSHELQYCSVLEKLKHRTDQNIIEQNSLTPVLLWKEFSVHNAVKYIFNKQRALDAFHDCEGHQRVGCFLKSSFATIVDITCQTWLLQLLSSQGLSSSQCLAWGSPWDNFLLLRFIVGSFLICLWYRRIVQRFLSELEIHLKETKVTEMPSNEKLHYILYPLSLPDGRLSYSLFSHLETIQLDKVLWMNLKKKTDTKLCSKTTREYIFAKFPSMNQKDYILGKSSIYVQISVIIQGFFKKRLMVSRWIVFYLENCMLRAKIQILM